MALIDLWKASPAQLTDKHVQQLISFAGSGHLGDNNAASAEFREFLRNVPIEHVRRYSEECLVGKFDGSGFALQDVVNEVGTRLGFAVSPGRYRGTQGHIGFDGLWQSPEGRRIVIEVKTTDAYRIDLNTVAGYRRALIKEKGWLEEDVSILIVVGRQDTGDLEAQIRGSKHAWDIRLISVDSLLRLLDIKVELEDPQSELRVREILWPHEYTRVDGIIDLVFSTAEEVKQDSESDVEEPEVSPGKDSETEPKFVPVKFHEGVAKAVASHLGTPLVRQSRAFYANPAKDVGVLCSVSKRHSGSVTYWYGFHPYQRDKLKPLEHGYVAFGCGSADLVVLIPFATFEPLLNDLNQTHLEGRYYWHVHIAEEGEQLVLRRKGGLPSINVTDYVIRRQA